LTGRKPWRCIIGEDLLLSFGLVLVLLREKRFELGDVEGGVPTV
jgi:hypothetical protein